MAGYGYTGRGHTTYNGIEPRTNEWSKTSYEGNGNPDHVCRPVIIDAEGRKQPIIRYTPNHGTESYVTKTETIIEHVQTPVLSEYKYSSAAMDPPKDYGVVNNKWGTPLSPVYDRPQKVEEFITQVQTEVSRPTRTGPLISSTYWRPAPNSTSRYGTTDYDDYTNFSNNEWNKPIGQTTRDKDLDDYRYRNDNVMEPAPIRPNRAGWAAPPSRATSFTTPTNEWNKPTGNTTRDKDFDDYRYRNANAMEPAPITYGGWAAKPNRAGWAALPSRDTPLSKPTNDISVALEPLKEAITAAAPRPQFPISVSTVPKRDTYADTIDSREAARRYGKFNESSRPPLTVGRRDYHNNH